MFAAVAVMCFSCKKVKETHPGWDANVLAPLLQSSLTIHDLLADSLLQSNADNSLSLIFNNPLFHFSLADETIDIPDTTIKASFSLQNLNLANQTLTYPLSLGQMCQQLGVLGIFIIAANGGVFPIPAISDISTGDNDIDATQFFQAADLESGFIDLTLQNGLPIEISNMVFQVRNKIDQQILTQDTFLNLLPNQSQTKTIDLSGKHVEGTLTAKILDLDSPGGTVLIDTSNALVISMVAHDLVVSEATAIFPAQNLIDEDHETTYELSGGAELDQLKVSTGTLLITLESTIEQKSHFEFALPSAHDAYGNSISLSEDLPPAPPGGTSGLTKSFNLSGYTFDLTGVSGTEHNTYFTHLVASIDSTGELVTISKNDSVHIDYTLQGIVPGYVKGFLGQQILNIGPATTPFEGLKNIQGGTLGLEAADISMTIKNGVGVPARINLYNLTSVNSSTGKNVALTWTQLNVPLSIASATDNPFTPSFTTFNLNNSNSNIKSLIDNLPDSLKYSLDIFINPNGNVSNYHDFAYDTSALDVDLNLSIPLSLVATNLTLQDTFDFSLGTQEEGDPTIKEGIFNLIADNGFPLSASSQLYFYDDELHFLDSLFTSSGTIAAGKLNDQCLVSEKTKTVLTIPVDEAKMNRLRSAKKVIVRSSFSTTSTSACNSYLKIYDDYVLDLKLTGSFTFYTGY